MKRTSAIFAPLRLNSGAIEAYDQPRLPAFTVREPHALRAPILNAETRRTQRTKSTGSFPCFCIFILLDLSRISDFGFRIFYPGRLFTVFSLLSLPLTCLAQIELLPPPEPVQLFGGGARSLTVTWHNSGQEAFRQPLSIRLYQASSATAIPLDTIPWKALEVLPGQTVIESVWLSFPAVRAETQFVIQWIAGSERVLGTSEVRVYPTNLLQELKTLAGDAPLGILDPQNQLKPLLKAAAIEFTDFADANTEEYLGKLVIAGPFRTKSEMREGLASQLRALARKGVCVVWLQPPPARSDPLKPSFYTVIEGKGAMLIVQAYLVARLADSPQSQLNLVHLARLAVDLQPGAARNADFQCAVMQVSRWPSARTLSVSTGIRPIRADFLLLLLLLLSCSAAVPQSFHLLHLPTTSYLLKGET